MRAVDCVCQSRGAGEHWQLVVNELIDDFRRGTPAERVAMTRDPIACSGPLEGLVAATLSALCREVGMTPPPWVAKVHSPEPFFAFPARSFALRVRLMIESPPPFRVRNVFVPANYLERA